MHSDWMNMAVTARLGVGQLPDGGGDTEAALTPVEARQLAAALLPPSIPNVTPEPARWWPATLAAKPMRSLPVAMPC